MSELKSYEFICKHCGKVFERKWTVERALEEYRKMFRKLPDMLYEDNEVLCDDCHKKAMMKSSQ